MVVRGTLVLSLPLMSTTITGKTDKDAPSSISAGGDSVNENVPTLERTDSYLDDTHIDLGWRSYVTVIVACFGYELRQREEHAC